MGRTGFEGKQHPFASMKVSAFFSALCGVGLLLALNAASVECARHTSYTPQTLFVFGDSFADTGNLPPTKGNFEMSRQWKAPYGMSNRVDGSGRRQQHATGRFSDFMVQSDFIAKMLGLPQSPPTYLSTPDLHCDPSGMNFAFYGAGMFRFPGEMMMMSVSEQVDVFESMIKDGTISHNHVTHSVALLAVSGTDYNRFNVSGFSSATDCIEKETTEIIAITQRLQNLGVKKILVNNLQPLGCTPFWCRPTLYHECDEFGNVIAFVHNKKLKHKLPRNKGIFIVDMYTAFNNIIADHGSKSYKQFEAGRKPCCEGYGPRVYCGEQHPDTDYLFYLCKDPSKRFFWDDTHPTHAGWEAVMKQLEEPIKEFLGVV
ncbi:hypothetical protein CFC21_032264 [Triticum aestivum]|uniref:GDSL esterase/lipase n=2 Tax=Triticum aestivum TaxID=4565 RepID=A0A9R1EZN7_WHEAT|nr:GDSL esterase/lipase At5g03610-like [Triticum aestivum]KAF7019034.1 hypothetical protein CFC21_032263 [Triticum aestivum]KAF7019037.1 hypothetical protein CFC21_032264 [Triticum aestivum]